MSEALNWEAIGSIAEVLGAIAIFVSLIYVAVQIRQNTEQSARNVHAMELAAIERNIESSIRIREMFILNPDVAELLRRGSVNYKELDAKDAFRFGLILRNIFSSIQGAYVRQTTLKHDPLEFSGTVRHIDELLEGPGVRDWLNSCEPDWRPAFAELVNSRLDRIRKSEPTPDTQEASS